MYSIDFDEKTGLFQALFCHGTSSETLPSILQNGIVRPRYDDVLQAVLAGAPHLNGRHELFADAQNGALGLNDRALEKDVEFATWFGNVAGAHILTQEIDRVVKHGGEVFATTWASVKRIAERNNLQPPVPRYPNAKPQVVLFRIPFELCAATERAPRTKYDEVQQLSWAVFEKDLGAYDGLMEIKFLDPLPPEMILWHGTPAEALKQIDTQLMSPEAQKAVARADPSLARRGRP